MGCKDHVIERLEEAAFRVEFGPTTSPEEEFARRFKNWFNDVTPISAPKWSVHQSIAQSIGPLVGPSIHWSMSWWVDHCYLCYACFKLKLNTIPIPSSPKFLEMKKDAINILTGVIQDQDSLRGDYIDLAMSCLVINFTSIHTFFFIKHQAIETQI